MIKICELQEKHTEVLNREEAMGKEMTALQIRCHRFCHLKACRVLMWLLVGDLSEDIKVHSPPQVSRFCRSTRWTGHEQRGVPSPLAMQMWEQPPLSRAHGWAAVWTKQDGEGQVLPSSSELILCRR